MCVLVLVCVWVCVLACPVRGARLALRPLQLCWPSARLGWCGISRECRPVRVGMAVQSVSRPTQFHLLLHTHAQTRTPTQKLSSPISKSCPGPKPAFWPLALSLTFHDTIYTYSAMKVFYVCYRRVWLEISTVFKYISYSFIVGKVGSHCICFTWSKSNKLSVVKSNSWSL